MPNQQHTKNNNPKSPVSWLDLALLGLAIIGTFAQVLDVSLQITQHAHPSPSESVEMIQNEANDNSETRKPSPQQPDAPLGEACDRSEAD